MRSVSVGLHPSRCLSRVRLLLPNGVPRLVKRIHLVQTPRIGSSVVRKCVSSPPTWNVDSVGELCRTLTTSSLLLKSLAHLRGGNGCYHKELDVSMKLPVRKQNYYCEPVMCVVNGRNKPLLGVGPCKTLSTHEQIPYHHHAPLSRDVYDIENQSTEKTKDQPLAYWYLGIVVCGCLSVTYLSARQS